MKTKSISIIGLGWLGLPLYHKLTSAGYACKGSTTSNEKKTALLANNISAFRVLMQESEIAGEIANCLENSEILILNTPPGLRRNPNSNYVAKIERLIPFIENSSVKKVLFIGSTSVFEDEPSFPTITNNTLPNATTNAGKQLIAVENLLFKNTHFETTILRFAGLVNEERHPAKMMSKRPKAPNPLAPVNLIHRKDCIGIISAIIQQNYWGKIINAAYPKHFTKKEYYDSVCARLALDKPNFDTATISKGKLIDGSKTALDLKYTYEYVV